jgi:hypothetical protein
MCIDLVLADPNPMMLEGMTHVFEASPEFSVKASESSGEAVLQALEQHQPHILVVDLSLTHRGGLALLQEMQTRKWKTRAVVFTGAALGDVLNAVDLDVAGLVSKEKNRHVLMRCIHVVHRGGRWLDRDLTDKSFAHLLTPRELSVARLVTAGLPSKTIASQLLISEGTAKLHLHRVYQKLNCSGRMALQRLLHEHGVN